MNFFRKKFYHEPTLRGRGWERREERKEKKEGNKEQVAESKGQ